MISCNNFQCCSIIASQQKTIDSLNRFRETEKESHEKSKFLLYKTISELQSKLKALESYAIQQEDKCAISNLTIQEIENKLTTTEKNLANQLMKSRNITQFLKLEVSLRKLNYGVTLFFLDTKSQRRNIEI